MTNIWSKINREFIWSKSQSEWRKRHSISKSGLVLIIGYIVYSVLLCLSFFYYMPIFVALMVVAFIAFCFFGSFVFGDI